ncbi:MAG: YmfQ family protein [Candidatus Pristimantibacillus lignocellulolyticus]|uniref:YmfQ family protein n=1 Tax=Candidatus Pristimantibacillus lignocellulolyticus TaxID=2994561 RepID=A0A9J6ZFH5_9BACL|nr:MAG: YmfQ family protein [Candidatus Pristimantibacillus lignocellulolyticus]
MSYGESMYGAISFGDNKDPDSQSETLPKNLMDYLPYYWRDIRDMVELQSTVGEELGISQSALAELNTQAFLTTATWGLEYWEREFGLTTDPSMSDSWRREILMAKIRGHGTVTKQMIISAAIAFSGGDVEIVEYQSESRFVVRFIGMLGIPANMAGFIAMLEQMKPAHLSFSFDYSYTTWDKLKDMTWANAGQMTWGQLRTYEGG